MKQIFKFAVMMMLVPLSTAMAEATRFDAMEKVADSKALMGLFSVMTGVTRDGRPVEFFGWTELESTPATDAACAPAVRSDAEHYLTSLIEELDWATHEESVDMTTHLVPALSDLREILDSDQLERCDWSAQPEQQRIKFTRFKNTATGYQITFTQGFRAS